ncbi:hypothetical protein HAX54_006481, partial [Datura stramonium]|nr:hypothetical protein [Datura stramonium]
MSMTKDRGGFAINGQWDTSREGERERAEKEEQEVGGGVVSYPNSEATRGTEGRRWIFFRWWKEVFRLLVMLSEKMGRRVFRWVACVFAGWDGDDWWSVGSFPIVRRSEWRVVGDAGDEEERGEEGSEAAAGSDLSPENMGRRERGWSGDEGEEGVGGCMLFFQR